MTRVIHTGDTHIGYQQYNEPERRRDFLRAFRQVITDAIEQDVDAVVHAGDLFHDSRPGLIDLQGTIDALSALAGAGIPFLAIVGNHERKHDAQWIDLLEDLGLATRLGRKAHVVGDVAFYGLDFVPRSRRDDLEYDFEPSDADFTTLVAHGLFEPFAHAEWDTEAVLEACSVDVDALLIGDNHVPDVARVEDTWVTYCGSTERASAAERDERGYNVVTFGADGDGSEDGDDKTGSVENIDGHETESTTGDDRDDENESGTPDEPACDSITIARRGLDVTRSFVFVDRDLAPSEGEERLREDIRQHDVEDAVVIVSVTGDGEPISPAAIESFADEQGALLTRITDHREIEVEEELSVHFADPDEAVRERLRELGLSEAARGIDETVRDDTVADSNVRDAVERRVRGLLEDDPDSLEPAPTTDSAESTRNDGELTTDSDESAKDGVGSEDGSVGSEDGTGRSKAASGSDGESTDEQRTDSTSTERDETVSNGLSEEDDDPEDSSDDSATQLSMGEFT